MMPILVKGDDVRSGTKANACHGILGGTGVNELMLLKFYWIFLSSVLLWFHAKVQGVKLHVGCKLMFTFNIIQVRWCEVYMK